MCTRGLHFFCFSLNEWNYKFYDSLDFPKLYDSLDFPTLATLQNKFIILKKRLRCSFICHHLLFFGVLVPVYPLTFYQYNLSIHLSKYKVHQINLTNTFLLYMFFIKSL